MATQFNYRDLMNKIEEDQRARTAPWSFVDPNLKRAPWEPSLNPQTKNPIAPYAPPSETSSSTSIDQSFSDYVKTHVGKGDAWAYLESILHEYGLSDLKDFAKQSIVDGLSSNEIMQRLRTTTTYKTRFQAIEKRKEMGLPPISETEVLAYERQATQLMRSAGMPKGFWDSPEDFAKLQVNDISISELESRVNRGYMLASQASPEDRKQWKELGYTEGELAAFFLDPDRTTNVIQQQFGAVQRAQEAQRTGYGQLTRQDAERLSALGITQDQAVSSFSKLANSKELFNSLPGENADAILQQDQLKAAFESDQTQQARITKRADERIAAFKQGSGVVQNKQGFAGIGESR